MLIRLFMDSDGSYWVSLHRCIQMASHEWCHKYAFRFMDKSRDEIKGIYKGHCLWLIIYESVSKTKWNSFHNKPGFTNDARFNIRWGALVNFNTVSLPKTNISQKLGSTGSTAWNHWIPGNECFSGLVQLFIAAFYFSVQKLTRRAFTPL